VNVRYRRILVNYGSRPEGGGSSYPWIAGARRRGLKAYLSSVPQDFLEGNETKRKNRVSGMQKVWCRTQAGQKGV